MLEAQTKGVPGNVYIANRTTDGSALIPEERQIPFIVHDQERWLQVFDQLKEAGVIEEIFVDDDMTTDQIVDDFKQGWADFVNGNTIPLSKMWEGIDVD